MNDQIFSLTTRIERPAAAAFAWHEQPDALARLVPPWEQVELLSRIGGIRNGAKVVVRNKIGPFWSEWRVEHRDYVEGKQFRDVLQSGPMARWEHLHRIEPDGPAACFLTDEVTYRLPLGALGQLAGGGFTQRQMARMFTWRHATTKADLETTARYGAIQPLRILVSGASGLIGRTLVPFLRMQGHEVVRLVRRPAVGADEVSWNPAKGELDPAKVEGIDAVIHLAGENVGEGRWSPARQDEIIQSRVSPTRLLVETVGKLKRKPAAFVSASAIGFYGDRGDDILTDASGRGRGFLPDVCVAWETEAEESARFGLRTALLRIGIVLTPAGGALAKLGPVFRAGLGGRVGSGKQWMSWVSIDDVVGAIYHTLLDTRCYGPMNVVAPEVVTNSDFAKTLGRVFGRPAVVPVPAVALRTFLGQMADETLLASTRVVPVKLQAADYVFRHPTLESALRHVLGQRAG